MLKIDFYGLDFERQDQIELFLKAVWKDFFSDKDATMEFTFVDAQEIALINADIRGLDKETDVLSLEYETNLKDNLINITTEIFLGEIFLNIDCIERQAIDNGHSFEREMLFLSLHALLHLIGFDHMNEADEKTMREQQTKIMNFYNKGR